jgi:hypothetical protein
MCSPESLKHILSRDLLSRVRDYAFACINGDVMGKLSLENEIMTLVKQYGSACNADAKAKRGDVPDFSVKIKHVEHVLGIMKSRGGMEFVNLDSVNTAIEYCREIYLHFEKGKSVSKG